MSSDVSIAKACHYRMRAKEVRQIAETTKASYLRAQLRQMALQWEELADQVEGALTHATVPKDCFGDDRPVGPSILAASVPASDADDSRALYSEKT